MTVSEINLARMRTIVREARMPRPRAEIEAASYSAAKHGSQGATQMLHLEVLLDIRDFMAECAVQLSEIAGEVATR